MKVVTFSCVRGESTNNFIGPLQYEPDPSTPIITEPPTPVTQLRAHFSVAVKHLSHAAVIFVSWAFPLIFGSCTARLLIPATYILQCFSKSWNLKVSLFQTHPTLRTLHLVHPQWLEAFLETHASKHVAWRTSSTLLGYAIHTFSLTPR